MTDDPERRYDAAIDSGASLAAPVEPGLDARAILDTDRLRGRPFFEAVEARAAAAAANRVTTWIPSHDEDRREAVSIDGVAASARGLAREITQTVPTARIALLTGDEVLEAILLNDRDRLAQKVADQAATWTDDGAEAARQTRALLINTTDVAEAGAASAISLPGNDTRPDWHLVFTARAGQDPHAKRHARLQEAFEGSGMTLQTAFRQSAPSAAMLRATNDHEMAHVLTLALGLRGRDADAPYARYLEENRADAFMVAMAVARDGRAEQVSSAYAELRDTYAVAAEDWGHWTTPAIQAARAHAHALHRDGQLQFMPVAEVMRTFSAVAEGAALAEPDYNAFCAALYERTIGSDAPFDHAPTAAGTAAADAALHGYMTARLRNATTPEAAAQQADGWRTQTALANPGHRRALELAGHQAAIDASSRRAQVIAYHSPDNPARNRALAGELTTLFSAAGRLVEADRRHPAAAGDPAPDHAGCAFALRRAERSARQVAEARTPGARDLQRLTAALSIAEAALKEAGPWTAAAARKVGDVAHHTRSALETSRGAASGARPAKPAEVVAE